MSKAKDCRIVVRMSEELRAWITAEASLREIDEASFVRMTLAAARNGISFGSPVSLPPVYTTPASLPRYQPNELAGFAADPVGQPPAVDVDAIVRQHLELAEAEGLAKPITEDHDDDIATGSYASGRGPRVLGPRPSRSVVCLA